MAAQARIAGTVMINGQPAVRDVVVISDDPSGRQVVGGGQSASDGTFDITYTGWSGNVIALALDSYGDEFTASTALNLGAIVHPTTPNGYVYEVTGGGTTGTEEPTWSTSSSVTSGSVTFNPVPYYRPVASGPLTPEVTGVARDPYFDNVVALLHMDGDDESTTFVDVKGNTWTAIGAAKLDTDAFRFGGSSMIGNGVDSVIDTPDSPNFALGADDFTIEGWIRPASDVLDEYRNIMSQRYNNTTNNALTVFINKTNGNIVAQIRDGATTYGAGGPPATVEEWSHFAVVRNGNSMTVYTNGVGGTPVDVTGVTVNDVPEPLAIGGSNSVSYQGHFSGHIDEIRVTKGVARYTADFTPPTEPFPDLGPE